MPSFAPRAFAILLTLVCSIAPARADDEAVAPAKPVKPAAAQVGAIKLHGSLRDGPVPFSWVHEADAGPSLRSVIKQLRHVAASDKHKGIVFFLDQPQLSNSQIDEISAAVRETRKAGKKVLFFAEAYDLSSYVLACSGDQVLLQQKGFLEMVGSGVEEMYLAGLFEKIGIKADYVQTGKFKGADEQMTRKGPSKEWSENFDALLDDMYGQTLDTISKSRKMDKAAIEKAMVDSLSMGDTDMVKAGLIDRVTTRDILDVTKKAFGNQFDWDESMGLREAGGAADMSNPFAMLKILMAESKSEVRRESIAIVQCEGVITSGESSSGGMFGGTSVGSNTILQALKEAKNEPLIKGVIVRINSPGGSALASEIMWQAMRDVAKEKPIWVSVGSLAASGGYYMSAGADKVYASPKSIVGSIGVVSGKMAMGGLYDWAGIKIHRRSRGPLGDMFNSVDPFTPEQKKALTAMSERIYEQFTDRVKKGRGDKVKDIAAVAQGRLFTGNQAKENGLIDEIGGIEIALADMAAQLKLEAGQYDVINLPGPMSLPQFLSSMLGGVVQAPRLSAEQMGVIGVVKTTLGPRAWPAVQQTLEGISLLQRERVLTIMPHAIVVR
jgi:protease-4